MRCGVDKKRNRTPSFNPYHNFLYFLNFIPVVVENSADALKKSV